MVFKNLSIPVLWTKVALVLEELKGTLNLPVLKTFSMYYQSSQETPFIFTFPSSHLHSRSISGRLLIQHRDHLSGDDHLPE